MGNKNQKGQGGTNQQYNNNNKTDRTNLKVVPTDFFVRQVGHHGLPHGTRSIAYSANQQLLAVGTDIGLVKVYGSYSGVEATFVDPGCKSAVTSLLFSHTGSTLIVIHANTAIRLFDLRKQCKRGEVQPGWTGDMISAVHLCPAEAKAPYLYVGTDDGTLHVLHLLKMEFTEYKISAEDFDVRTNDDDNYDEIVAIESNPQDFNEVLVAHEFNGVSLWNISKRQRLKKYVVPKEILSRGCRVSAMSDRGSFGGLQRPAISSISWHPFGNKHFVVGFANGFLAIFDAGHKSSGKVQKLHYEDISMPTRLTSVEWVADMKGEKGPGHFVVSGGHETSGVTILYRNPLHKKSQHLAEWVVGDVAMPMTADGPVNSLLLPTWDSSPVMKLLVTYPKGLSPAEIKGKQQPGFQALGIGSHHPSSYILLSGDPQDGIHPRVYIQALPSRIADLHANWPPIACDPPEPTPQIMHFPSPLRRSMVVLVKDCGLCPEEVIQAIRAAKPNPDYPQSWKYPISGGNCSNSSKRRSLVATGHVDGTLCLWAASPPTDGISVDLEEDGVINTPLDLLYEFEPSLLCQSGGYKAPQRPALTCMELHLPSRLLCLGTECGDVIICAVRPRPISWGVNDSKKPKGNNSKSTGSAVFLLHCLQNIHTSRIVGISLHAESGLLAIADSSGKCTILDVESGNLHDVDVPSRDNLVFGENSHRNNGPVRSIATANVPLYDHNMVVKLVPCVIFGMADSTIAVCNLQNGAPVVVFDSSGCEDPITNMLIIDQNGLAPKPMKSFKRYSNVFKDESTTDTKNEGETNSEEKQKDDYDEQTNNVETINQAQQEENENGISQDNDANNDKILNKSNDSNKEGDDNNDLPIKKENIKKEKSIQSQRRFVVAVAGHEVFVVALKIHDLGEGEGSIASDSKRFVKVKPLAHAGLDGTTVSSAAAVVLGNSDTKNMNSTRCLICVDNMNRASILALPRLQMVSQETLPTVGMTDYLRHVSIMDCGDIFLVTELSVLHRLAVTSIPTLGYGQGPNLLREKQQLTTKQKVQKSNKPKKSTVFSMFGGGKAEINLNEIFSTSIKDSNQKKNMASLLGSLNELEEDDDGNNNSSSGNNKKIEGELAGVGNVMNKNMRKLEERGEQLNDLQEATSKMMLNAMRFEEESRRIRKQAEKDAECVIS
jgi:WD40 repeat protein